MAWPRPGWPAPTAAKRGSPDHHRRSAPPAGRGRDGPRKLMTGSVSRGPSGQDEARGPARLHPRRAVRPVAGARCAAGGGHADPVLRRLLGRHDHRRPHRAIAGRVLLQSLQQAAGRAGSRIRLRRPGGHARPPAGAERLPGPAPSPSRPGRRRCGRRGGRRRHPVGGVGHRRHGPRRPGPQTGAPDQRLEHPAPAGLGPPAQSPVLLPDRTAAEHPRLSTGIRQSRSALGRSRPGRRPPRSTGGGGQRRALHLQGRVAGLRRDPRGQRLPRRPQPLCDQRPRGGRYLLDGAGVRKRHAGTGPGRVLRPELRHGHPAGADHALLRAAAVTGSDRRQPGPGRRRARVPRRRQFRRRARRRAGAVPGHRPQHLRHRTDEPIRLRAGGQDPAGQLGRPSGGAQWNGHRSRLLDVGDRSHGGLRAGLAQRREPSGRQQERHRRRQYRGLRRVPRRAGRGGRGVVKRPG